MISAAIYCARIFMTIGWSWTAATFWRATADRFWSVSLGRGLETQAALRFATSSR